MNGAETPDEQHTLQASQPLPFVDLLGQSRVLPIGEHLFETCFGGGKESYATVQWERSHYKVRLNDDQLLVSLEEFEAIKSKL